MFILTLLPFLFFATFISAGVAPSQQAKPYVERHLNPASIVTLPKSRIQLRDNFTYFTIEDDVLAYGNATSSVITNLPDSDPLFAFESLAVIYCNDKDAIAFVRRPFNNFRDLKSPMAYGGRLALPASPFNDLLRRDSHQPLTQKVQLKSNWEEHFQGMGLQCLSSVYTLLLKEGVPGAAAVPNLKPRFYGFVSQKDRDARFRIAQSGVVSTFAPLTSAVFVIVVRTGKLSLWSDDILSHRLEWVPRTQIMKLAQEYSPAIHNQTFPTIQNYFHDHLNFQLTDFAFDHLKVVQSVVPCT